MGCCGDDEVVPKQDSPSSENGHSPPGSDEIFVKHRSNTDIPALIIMIILIGGFGYLMSVTVRKGDPFRILNGYDDCANVCGRKTAPESDPRYSCKGRDMTKFPYLLIDVGPKGVKTRECVSNCSTETHQLFLRYCVPKQATDTVNYLIRKIGVDNFFQEASSDLSNAYRELIYLLLIALALSLAILIAFRFMVQWVVYIVLTGSIVACIGGTTYLWLLWYDEKKAVDAGKIHEEDSSKTPYLIYAICLSSVTVVVLLIVLVMRKRIALVVQLFKEAGKAVAFMPCLLLQPVYTYLLIGLTVVGWVYAMLYIESAGNIYKNEIKNRIDYKKDALIIATRWYNLFLFIVTCEFFLGCQHMVIAGSVSRWFFTRDKRRLSMVIPSSFCYLIKYHLGTVCFGALVIGIVRIIRAIFLFIQKQLKKYENGCVQGILWCCQCCLWCFERVLIFLTRNAYVETSIYGCNFCTGGKKAFQALSSNVLRVVAINSVGNFVLFLGKVVVVALNVVAGVYLMQKKDDLHHSWVPIAIAAVFAFLVAHCFISVYEMIIDSIFICFCEDCAKNDGISRPYFMSRGLMEFVENSKKALRQLNRQSST